MRCSRVRDATRRGARDSRGGQRFSASAEIRYAPVRDGESAAIIAFQHEEYYYLLTVTRVAGRTVVLLEKNAGPQAGAAAVR